MSVLSVRTASRVSVKGSATSGVLSARTSIKISVVLSPCDPREKGEYQVKLSSHRGRT